MEFKGIIRKTDNLGRICIPKEYRKELNIEENEEVEIYLTECGGVYIKKVERK